MGQSEVKQIESWFEQLVIADDPLDVWYERIWDPNIDYRAIEGAPDERCAPTLRSGNIRPVGKVVVEELIDGGPERVIAVLRVSGTAKAAEFRLNCDLAYTIRGGRVVRGREYMTKEEAGAAVSQGS